MFPPVYDVRHFPLSPSLSLPLAACLHAGSGAYCDIRLGRVTCVPGAASWSAAVYRTLPVDARMGLPGATAIEEVTLLPDGGIALAASCDVRPAGFTWMCADDVCRLCLVRG
jgi:hypothetical protein